MENYYEILKIDKSAEAKDIKRAYARLVREFPPETHPEEFKKIRKAYDTLLDASSKAVYDSGIVYTSPASVDLIPKINSSLEDKEYYIKLIKSCYERGNISVFNEAVDNLVTVTQCSYDIWTIDYIYKELKIVIYNSFNSKQYKYSRILLSKLLNVAPNNKEILMAINTIYRVDGCKIRLEKFNSDNRIAKCIKDIIEIWLDEDIDANKKAEMLKAIEDQVRKTKKSLLMKSLKCLKQEYRNFYFIDSIYFDQLVRSSKKSSRFFRFIRNSKLRSSHIVAAIFIIIGIFVSFSTNKLDQDYNGISFKIPTLYSTHMKSKFLLPPDMKVPLTLPEGYKINECFITRIGDKKLTPITIGYYGKQINVADIPKDICYLKLVLAKGQLTFNYEAFITEYEPCDLKKGESRGIKDNETVERYEENRDERILILNSYFRELDTKKRLYSSIKFINYRISTKIEGGAPKEDLEIFAENLIKDN